MQAYIGWSYFRLPDLRSGSLGKGFAHSFGNNGILKKTCANAVGVGASTTRSNGHRKRHLRYKTSDFSKQKPSLVREGGPR